MEGLPQAVTRDQEFMAAMVDRLDAILDRLPEKQPAAAADGGPVEVREPDPPKQPAAEPREVREPRPRRAPAKKATSRARKGT